MTRRVALVTGAGGGLGRATALRLAADGWAIAALDVDAASAHATADRVRAAGGVGWAVECDVADEASVGAAVAVTIERHGRIDGVVTCAGIARVAHAEEITLAEWQRQLDVNLTGTFLVLRDCLPALLESRGSIVTVASLAAVRGWRYLAAYSATKGGVVALTRTIAVEFGRRGVRANCICPGSIDTPLREALEPVRDPDPALLGRAQVLTDPPAAQPEEIAGGIAYLLSDEARFVTGAVHVIDGGVSA